MSSVRTVILVGAGHAHLYVAARAKELIEAGARVVLIDPGTFWYSGLATGMLGGMYPPETDQIDPRPLAEAQGVEFIEDSVASVDPIARQLRLASGEQLAYDYVSINVGSRVTRNGIVGVGNDPTVWTVKPIQNLWKLRQHLEARFAAAEALRVAVVGGGPTGAEVAANLVALAARHGSKLSVTLIAPGERLLQRGPAGAARALQRKLAKRGVTILLRTRITARDGHALVAEDGSRLAADIVVLAIGLEANTVVAGLPTRCKHGLRVNDTLRSIADERVFASGDCAAMEGVNLPKLGVFGVRQAPYIHANLLASLQGKPLFNYRPQKRYLAILNLGDGTALASWGPFWWTGRLSMWLKNRLDQRFLARYRTRGPTTQ